MGSRVLFYRYVIALCLLFTLYTTPLSSLVSRHAIPHHLYADDSQLYVSFSSGDSAAALNGLQSCLASVQSWMSTNKLKLNQDQTEFLLIGNERQWSKYLSMFPIELLGVGSCPADLLAILEWSLTKTSTSAHIYLQSVVHVFTTSRIYGVFAVTLIWMVQNCLRVLQCLAILITVFPFVWDCGNWPHQAPTCFEPSGSCGHKVTTIYSQGSTAALPSLATLKYRSPFQDLLADLQGSSWGTARLPSLLDCHFSSITLTEIKQEESLCPSLGSRPTLVQGPSAHVSLLFGTTFH